MQMAKLVVEYLNAIPSLWPVFVGVLVWAFREPIKAALGRLTRVDALGVSAEFAAKVEDALEASPVTELPAPTDESMKQLQVSSGAKLAPLLREIAAQGPVRSLGVEAPRITLKRIVERLDSNVNAVLTKLGVPIDQVSPDEAGERLREATGVTGWDAVLSSRAELRGQAAGVLTQDQSRTASPVGEARDQFEAQLVLTLFRRIEDRWYECIRLAVQRASAGE